MRQTKILVFIFIAILFLMSCDVVESVTGNTSDAFLELYGNNHPWDIYDGTANSCDGNDDGIISQGEKARIQLRVTNTGDETAESVKLTVSTDDEYVSITNSAQQTIGNMDVNYTYMTSNANSSSSVLLDVMQGTPNGHIAELKVVFEDTYGNEWTDRFDIVIEPIGASVVLYGQNPRYIYDGSANGCSGNENGEVEAGEVVRLNMRVRNEGSSEAMMVTMLAQCSDDYVTILDDSTYTLGDMGYNTVSTPDANTNSALMISADAATPSGHAARIDVIFTDKFQNQWTDSFSVIVQ